MRYEVAYGIYVVYFDGQQYAAEPADPDADAFLQLRSRLLQTVIDGIDEIHACDRAMPEWLAAWDRGETLVIDLDTVRAAKA
jgi:hypothetical protein